MNVADSLTPRSGPVRHATFAGLAAALLVPGVFVQLLTIAALGAEAASFLDPVDELVVSIVPGVVLALCLGIVAEEWYGRSLAAGLAVVGLVVYSAACYAFLDFWAI